MQRSRPVELANRSNIKVKLISHLVADLVGDLPADGLRMVNLDRVAVLHPLLHMGDGADGTGGNVVAVAAGSAHWDRVAVLLGNPVAPGAPVLVLVLLLLLLLLLLPPLLLVPEGGRPLASVASVVALSGVRGGALLLVRGVVALLTHLKKTMQDPTPEKSGKPDVRVLQCSAQRARSQHARRTQSQSCKIFFLHSYSIQCLVAATEEVLDTVL